MAMNGRVPHCLCGGCVKCRARKRQRKCCNTVAPGRWWTWSDTYRWQFFRLIARDLFGPNANLQSTLRT
jgi:hypothetical protein